MNRIKKCTILAIIFTTLSLFCTTFAGNKSSPDPVIKIAILDNFNFQPNITNQYSTYYMPGLQVAAVKANKMGYKIEYKLFTYDRSPLGILSTIPSVKAWQPDVIIGPRNSNTFLLLEKNFSDILVLSPFATASQVDCMPDNFYSLAFSDKTAGQVMASFVITHYPKAGVFGVIEADCKNCMDLSQNFKQAYLKANPLYNLIYHNFLQTEVTTLDINKLLAGYQNGEIILLPDNSYASAILMARIVNALNQPIIFVGGDDWGTWINTATGKINAQQKYKGIRFTPWSFDIKNKNSTDFLINYEKIFHKQPEDTASYISYNALNSVITALKNYGPSNTKQDMREKILHSYLMALKNDPNWFRPPSYAVYELDSNSEKFLTAVTVSETQK